MAATERAWSPAMAPAPGPRPQATDPWDWRCAVRPTEDPHSLELPKNLGPIVWIPLGLIAVVATFVGIISLIPKY
jgi:hypothetical protein